MLKPLPPKPLDSKTARLRDARLARAVTPPAQRRIRLLGLDDGIGFGKHAGRTLVEVMDVDLSYVTWMLENIAELELTSEADREYRYRLDPSRPRGVRMD